MNDALITRACGLADKAGYALPATADTDGCLHLSATRTVRGGDGRGVSVSKWFCPGTVENVAGNDRGSVVVWDPDVDEGVPVDPGSGVLLLFSPVTLAM